MLTPSSPGHQTNLFGTDLLQQLDRHDPLLRLADAIPWRELDQAFSRHYTQGHRQADTVDGRAIDAEAAGKSQ
ncbi:MAG: hypothetical protein WAW41_09565 [Methylobacter sp.]